MDGKIVEALPPHIDVELTNRCSLSCDQCPYHGKDKIFTQEPCNMDYALYRKIIDEACQKNVKSVKLSFSGEPLLYPKFFEAVEYAKKRGLKVNINSNGLELTPNNCTKLIESGLDVIIITDYESDIQFQRITVLQTQKGWLSSNTPYVVIKSNRIGVMNKIADEVVPLDFYDYTKLEENYYKKEDFCCGFPWQRLLILANGDVMSCACGMGLIDYKNSFLGNANNFDLETLWKGPKMKFLRMVHEDLNSGLVRMCRMCPTRKDILERMYNE